MSSVYVMKVGAYKYLYESESYRDEAGKPRSRQRPIGKVDINTGEYIYKQEYIERMKKMGMQIQRVPPKGDFTVTGTALKKSKIVEYGAYYLLESIAEMCGLKEIVKLAIPEYWTELLTMAIYLICTEDPFMYCGHWVESTETLPVGDLSSQRISDILHDISEEDRSSFFKQWAGYRAEREYLALDITSISSWSSLIEDVEWGYNRDHEDLAQINLCLLMGERSRLPVFQTIYNGSLKDVSTLKTTIERATCYLKKDEPVLLVMDKGFYSKKNVDAMLASEANIKFIIPVPFTAKFAKDQIQSEKKDIDRLANTLVSGSDSVRGVSKKRAWAGGQTVFVHSYCNAIKAVKRKEDLYAHAVMLKQCVEAEKKDEKFKDDIQKYLIVRSSSVLGAGRTVNYREDVIEKELETAGWLVLISNHVSGCKEALAVYRDKDVIEKGFFRLKNSIDLERLRVHSQNSMQNKTFVGFIALILLSGIHCVMLDKELYAKMTMKEMLLIMKKQRIQYIDGHRVVFPATKNQKLIYEAFGVQEPC